MKPRFRAATPADLDAVLEIERASFRIPWTERLLAPELEGDERHLALLAEVADRVEGFALLWVIADEIHLVNFAVHPRARRRGIGRALLEEVFGKARERDARRITLEVRESNEAARELYRDFGFVDVAVRPRYYPDTREDAVIMLCELESGPEG